jgi:hypothetical protein
LAFKSLSRFPFFSQEAENEAARHEALLDSKKKMEREYEDKKAQKKQQHEQNKKVFHRLNLNSG